MLHYSSHLQKTGYSVFVGWEWAGQAVLAFSSIPSHVYLYVMQGAPWLYVTQGAIQADNLDVVQGSRAPHWASILCFFAFCPAFLAAKS